MEIWRVSEFAMSWRLRVLFHLVHARIWPDVEGAHNRM
jgi:hypothetical protein